MQGPACAFAREIIHKITGELDAFSFRSAVLALMELSSWGNTYLQDVSPWKIYKEDPDSQAVKDCMFTSLQVVALLSILADPFIPFTAPKIRRLLNLPALQNGDLQVALNKLETGEPIISTGHKIGEPELLFAKIVDRKDDSRLQIVNRQKEKLQKVLEAEKGEEREAIKPTIQYEDFAKLDFRTGTITTAEAVPKADKLLKLTVDLGSEQRTIVSGIAQFFKPEELPGQPVVVVANLAPRKLRGIESQGMILMAENDKGELAFVNPTKGWGNGWVVR